MLNCKKGVLTLLLFFIVSSAVTFALFWTQTKNVEFIYGESRYELMTKAKTIEKFLKEQGVEVSEQDLIWPEASTKIKDGMKIYLKKAVPVTIKLGTQPEKSILTTADTVAGALKEVGYILNDVDIVKPDKNQPIENDLRIEVTKVTYGIIKRNVPLKYETVRVANDTMIKGTEKVIDPGEPGEAVQSYLATYYNGQIVELEHLYSTTIEEPEEEIIHYGTVEPVTVDGYTFVPKKILKNVTLTAYSAQENISGKGPDHPLYGITRSGTKVKENHTIAVDPDIIPLGWWVYIEGYGLYQAEDTGGAIKGKKIDIYIEDLEAANEFGVKRNKTVYVIGPDKPEKDR